MQLASDAMFRLPPGGLGRALAALPQGRLWAACMPGADARAALSTLGEGAAGAMRQAAAALSGQDGASLARWCGLPFAVAEGEDTAPIGAALLADARALASLPPAARDDGGVPHGAPVPVPGWLGALLPAGLPLEAVSDPALWRLEVRLPTRKAWEGDALACLDAAAALCLDGEPPDAVGALLVAPGINLRPLAGLAGGDARARFVEAVIDAAAGPGDFLGRFRRSHFRRGAAADICAAVAAGLSSAAGGGFGRDGGWPVSWRACGHDPLGLVAAAGNTLLSAATAVRVGVPGGAG